MGFLLGCSKLLDMLLVRNIILDLGVKLLVYSKSYSFAKLLDCQKVLDLSYSGDLNRVNFGRSSKKKHMGRCGFTIFYNHILEKSGKIGAYLGEGGGCLKCWCQKNPDFVLRGVFSGGGVFGMKGTV